MADKAEQHADYEQDARAWKAVADVLAEAFRNYRAQAQRDALCDDDDWAMDALRAYELACGGRSDAQ